MFKIGDRVRCTNINGDIYAREVTLGILGTIIATSTNYAANTYRVKPDKEFEKFYPTTGNGIYFESELELTKL